MFEVERHGSVELVRMRHGKANAMDVDFFEGFGEVLEEVAGRETRAVVVTGAGKIFSAGVDLFRLVDGGEEYLDRFLSLFGRAMHAWTQFPKPMVAAVNGHAVAGGCVLVCAADHRIMAEGPGTIGLAESKVGVSFPAAALELARHAIAPRYLREVLYLGETYSPEEGRKRGLVDEVVPAEELEQKALAAAERLGAVEPEAFSLLKRQLRRPIVEAVERTAELSDEAVLARWRSPETLEAIRAYLKAAVGKK